MTLASSVKSLGIFWLIPLRHRVIARLVRGLYYFRVLEKIGFIRETEFYNIIINVENTRQGTVDTYYVPVDSKIIKSSHNLKMLINKLLNYMKDEGIDRIGRIPIEVSIYFRGLLFDKPTIGYIKARYRLTESRSKGDIEIDIVEYLDSSLIRPLLGDIIVKAYNQGIIRKRQILTLLESSLYVKEFYNNYIRKEELSEFIQRSIASYSEKIVVLASQPKPFKNIIGRYAVGVKDIQTLAGEMRDFLNNYNNIINTNTQKIEIYEMIKPILLPYRLNYIRPLFIEAKKYIVENLNELQIPIIKTSSLIVFDNKPLYSLTYSIAKGLLTILNQKYKKILEGSRVAWSDIEKIKLE